MRDEMGLVHVVLPSGCGWTSEDGASRIERAACGKGSQPAMGERLRTLGPSSNRTLADSTWNDMERSGDGQPRVEGRRRRDSVIRPRTSSHPK